MGGVLRDEAVEAVDFESVWEVVEKRVHATISVHQRSVCNKLCAWLASPPSPTDSLNAAAATAAAAAGATAAEAAGSGEAAPAPAAEVKAAAEPTLPADGRSTCAVASLLQLTQRLYEVVPVAVLETGCIDSSDWSSAFSDIAARLRSHHQLTVVHIRPGDLQGMPQPFANLAKKITGELTEGHVVSSNLAVLRSWQQQQQQQQQPRNSNTDQGNSSIQGVVLVEDADGCPHSVLSRLCTVLCELQGEVEVALVLGVRAGSTTSLSGLLPLSLLSRLRMRVFSLPRVALVVDAVLSSVVLEIPVRYARLLDHACLTAVWRSLALCDGSLMGATRTVKAILLHHSLQPMLLPSNGGNTGARSIASASKSTGTSTSTRTGMGTSTGNSGSGFALHPHHDICANWSRAAGALQYVLRRAEAIGDGGLMTCLLAVTSPEFLSHPHPAAVLAACPKPQPASAPASSSPSSLFTGFPSPSSGTVLQARGGLGGSGSGGGGLWSSSSFSGSLVRGGGVAIGGAGGLDTSRDTLSEINSALVALARWLLLARDARHAAARVHGQECGDDAHQQETCEDDGGVQGKKTRAACQDQYQSQQQFLHVLERMCDKLQQPLQLVRAIRSTVFPPPAPSLPPEARTDTPPMAAALARESDHPSAPLQRSAGGAAAECMASPSRVGSPAYVGSPSRIGSPAHVGSPSRVPPRTTRSSGTTSNAKRRGGESPAPTMPAHKAKETAPGSCPPQCPRGASNGRLGGSREKMPTVADAAAPPAIADSTVSERGDIHEDRRRSGPATPSALASPSKPECASESPLGAPHTGSAFRMHKGASAALKRRLQLLTATAATPSAAAPTTSQSAVTTAHPSMPRRSTPTSLPADAPAGVPPGVPLVSTLKRQLRSLLDSLCRECAELYVEAQKHPLCCITPPPQFLTQGTSLRDEMKRDAAAATAAGGAAAAAAAAAAQKGGSGRSTETRARGVPNVGMRGRGDSVSLSPSLTGRPRRMSGRKAEGAECMLDGRGKKAEQARVTRETAKTRDSGAAVDHGERPKGELEMRRTTRRSTSAGGGDGGGCGGGGGGRGGGDGGAGLSELEHERLREEQQGALERGVKWEAAMTSAAARVSKGRRSREDEEARDGEGEGGGVARDEDSMGDGGAPSAMASDVPLLLSLVEKHRSGSVKAAHLLAAFAAACEPHEQNSVTDRDEGRKGRGRPGKRKVEEKRSRGKGKKVKGETGVGSQEGGDVRATEISAEIKQRFEDAASALQLHGLLHAPARARRTSGAAAADVRHLEIF